MRLPATLILIPLPVLAAVPSLDRLDALPRLQLPAAEVRSAIEHHKAEPLTYAVGQVLALDQRAGVWEEAGQGTARWRLRIASEGARSLSLHLTGVTLPMGAQLWLSGSEGGDVQGPFGATRVSQGELWLPIVRAAEAVLEVQLPVASASDLKLRITEAFHGYRSFDEKVGPGGSESGDCNIDVACSAGSSWRPEIRSTVYLATPTAICTGTLMNNTRLDNRPLVLTANHCNIRSTNVTSLTAYFNVESDSCGGNSTGRVDQNLAGGSVLAGTANLSDDETDIDTDFTLVTLRENVPSFFNALYAGWDASSVTVANSGVSIHHPLGDEKKISVYRNAATRSDNQVICGDARCSRSFAVDAWQVRWAQGTTERGSSGSALWNQNHRVVGTLSGGDASCSTPNEPDLFARLDRAWTAGSAANSQLKAHLDPINSGALTLNSKEHGESSPLPDNNDIGGGEDEGGGGAFVTTLLLLLAAALRRQKFCGPTARRAWLGAAAAR